MQIQARGVRLNLQSSAAWPCGVTFGGLAGRGDATAGERENEAPIALPSWDMLMVDIDAALPGTVDNASGAVSTPDPGPDAYSVLDEVARRVWLADGRVLAVRADDIPGGGPAAATLRYAPFGG